MYYLQSRYYDPIVGRFINADFHELITLAPYTNKLTTANMFSYCTNNPIGNIDSIGCLDGNVLRLVDDLSAYAIFTSFANSLYTAFVTTLARISAYITGILLPKITALFWWQPWIVAGVVVAAVAIAVAAVTIARSKAQSKADAKVRKKVANKKHTYYEANFSSGIVSVGKGITQAKAVLRLKSGKHVFTMYSYNAKKVCALAGSSKPMWHAKERNEPNYYNHYHVSKHINSAHCWYLI